LTRIPVPEKGHFSARASAEKFPERPTEKIPENSKNDRKIALLNLFQEGGEQRKKDQKTGKKQKTALLILALSTISVSCMKIQRPRPPC